MIDRRQMMGLGLAATVATTARAQSGGARVTAWPGSESFPLWPGSPPNSPPTPPRQRGEMSGNPASPGLWMRGVAIPTVSVFRPKRPDGRAVLSIPGGGYSFVSVENEGINVAQALNPKGITVFVLTYRLPIDGWKNPADVPQQDAIRAMRLIRSRAREFRIDPDKLGIVGFSAGGHLGATLATGHADRVYADVDAADRLSARPAFAGLVYAVTTIAVGGPKGQSRKNLLGDDPDPALVARYAAESRIDMNTPPIFLVHAIDDGLVPVDMSLSTLATARAAGVPVEAHLYEKGGHGFGVGNGPDHPAAGWTDIFDRWITRQLAG